MRLSPPLIRAGREMLEIEQRDFAAAAGISPAALSNIERGISGGRGETHDKIEAAFRRLGLEIIPDGMPSLGGGPGLRLAAKGR